MNAIIDTLLASMVILCVILQKTYSVTPIKEVKRRARAGNEVDRMIYSAASYGQSLRALLWLLIIMFSAIFFLVISRSAPSWFALTASIALIWTAYVWLPSSRVSGIGLRLATNTAPVLGLLLNYLHPLLHFIGGLSRGAHTIPLHTKLYEKEDLLNLLNQQLAQTDNRIDQAEIEIAISALNFGDQLIRKRLTPRRAVKTIQVNEPVGPILMTELHASGHSRFPVYDGKKDNIVGVLYMRDLVDVKAEGTVKNVMKKKVGYVNEEQNLYDALQSIIKTHHHLLVVVNSFEEYVGIITLEDVMEQIVGKTIIDEFDQYDDLRAVASREAVKERKEHEENQIQEDSTTPETQEVIE